MATSSLSGLLSALHTHLNTQTQLLPTLHAQLGLPQSALEDELNTLQQTLTRAVDEQIHVRRKQVQEWVDKCQLAETGCARYARALGNNTRAAASLGELEAEKVLPRRYERALECQEKLRQIYHTKLEQLTTLTNRLTNLSRTLGSDYFHADIVQPCAAPDEDPDDPNALRDVMPERFAKLEKELVRGKGEVTKRLNQLADIFAQIDWLYTELGLEPPDTSPNINSTHTLAVPSYPLPRSSSSSSYSNFTTDPFLASVSTPTPSAQTHSRAGAPLLGLSSSSPPHISCNLDIPAHNYHTIFAQFVSLLDSATTKDPSPASLLSSLNVEPTHDIIAWAEKLCTDLTEQKKRREAHIQAMYDQLEALWRRMGVDEDGMDGFVEANRGTTPQAIQAYEEELERMIDLKRERMGEFIGNARAEIEALWEELMVGDEEREEFAAFVDDEHTEDLLSQHEHEISTLKAEVRAKTPLLAAIRKYFEICEEEKELERAANDQTRLLGRGAGGGGGGGREPGRLLREEKMRKRVGKEKPKLEQTLLSSLPSWETKHGRAFLVHGRSMLQFLMESVSAGEQENRKKGASSQYQYSVPAPAANKAPGLKGTNGYIPGKAQTTGVVTPAVRPGSSLGPGTGAAYSNKRQKLAEPTPKGRTPSANGGSGLPRPTSLSTSQKGMSTSMSHKHLGPHPPMPQSQAQTQAKGYAGLGWGRAPSTTGRSGSGSTSASVSGSGSGTYGKAGRARRERESFKPRPSIDAGGWRGGPGVAQGFSGGSLVEEDEC
ncbi:hypothetical protein BV22DRAFT_1070288 [Leucogyrophana mollusca]|uniref:Uncharacterized protein n=1 Tax=Leucogyrophana mollusca TaxID=85980 RepID=A0ACB8BA20_9AGAM|nr:hypothetical protein BV22DRAFT_1070288 [Leucogyrophana mollusca]